MFNLASLYSNNPPPKKWAMLDIPTVNNGSASRCLGLPHFSCRMCTSVGGKRKNRNWFLLFLTGKCRKCLVAEDTKVIYLVTALNSPWISAIPGAPGFILLVVRCHSLRICQRGSYTHCASWWPGYLAPFSWGQHLGSSKLVCQVTHRY